MRVVASTAAEEMIAERNRKYGVHILAKEGEDGDSYLSETASNVCNDSRGSKEMGLIFE
jgi:hypothetical protein